MNVDSGFAEFIAYWMYSTHTDACISALMKLNVHWSFASRANYIASKLTPTHTVSVKTLLNDEASHITALIK